MSIQCYIKSRAFTITIYEPADYQQLTLIPLHKYVSGTVLEFTELSPPAYDFHIGSQQDLQLLLRHS